MKEGDFFKQLPETEPDKERVKFCLYCYDFYPEKAIETVATIDGKDEAVCADHAWVLKELGLALDAEKKIAPELTDALRDHVKDVTRIYFEFKSVRDLENGL